MCVYIVQIQRRIGAYDFIVYFKSLPSKGFNLIEIFLFSLKRVQHRTAFESNKLHPNTSYIGLILENIL